MRDIREYDRGLRPSGELLTKVMYAFGGQSSVNTTDEIQELERELYPLLSKHSDDISLNPQLFRPGEIRI